MIASKPCNMRELLEFIQEFPNVKADSLGEGKFTGLVNGQLTFEFSNVVKINVGFIDSEREGGLTFTKNGFTFQIGPDITSFSYLD